MLFCANAQSCNAMSPSNDEHPSSVGLSHADTDAPAVLPMDLTVQVSELFRALADPTRTRVVHSLLHHDMTTSGLAALLGVNPPAVSQHLRLLRALRIVKPRREGQLVYYALDDEHIRMLITLIVSHLKESGLTPQPSNAGNAEDEQA